MVLSSSCQVAWLRARQEAQCSARFPEPKVCIRTEHVRSQCLRWFHWWLVARKNGINLSQPFDIFNPNEGKSSTLTNRMNHLLVVMQWVPVQLMRDFQNPFCKIILLIISSFTSICRSLKLYHLASSSKSRRFIGMSSSLREDKLIKRVRYWCIVICSVPNTTKVLFGK